MITRSATINFDKEIVKSAIEKVADKKLGAFAILNKNDVFDTYTLLCLSMSLSLYEFTISLSGEVEKTIINIQTSDERKSANIMNQEIDRFMNLLSMALKGSDINKETVKSTSKGCSVLIFLLILTGITASILNQIL